MNSKFTAGAIAGIIGGLVFGMMMQMMSVATPDGGSMPMMGMVAKVVGSSSLAAGWAFHLVNSVVIGVLFALILGGRVHGNGSGAALGAAWGILWWIVGGLLIMPVALGMPAFAPVTMPGMQPVAIGSFMGHLIFGAIMGFSFARLVHAGHEGMQRSLA